MSGNGAMPRRVARFTKAGLSLALHGIGRLVRRLAFIFTGRTLNFWFSRQYRYCRHRQHVATAMAGTEDFVSQRSKRRADLVNALGNVVLGDVDVGPQRRHDLIL